MNKGEQMLCKLIYTGTTGGDERMSHREITVSGFPEFIFAISSVGQPRTDLTLSCVTITHSGERNPDDRLLWSSIKADIENGFLEFVKGGGS